MIGLNFCYPRRSECLKRFSNFTEYPSGFWKNRLVKNSKRWIPNPQFKQQEFLCGTSLTFTIEPGVYLCLKRGQTIKVKWNVDYLDPNPLEPSINCNWPVFASRRNGRVIRKIINVRNLITKQMSIKSYILRRNIFSSKPLPYICCSQLPLPLVSPSFSFCMSP